MNQEKKFLKIARLIASEYSQSISQVDREYLDNWVNESIENQNIYDDIKKEGWYTSNLKGLENYKVEQGWNDIDPRIQSTSKIRKLIPNIYKYAAAAVVVGILVTTYFFRYSVFNMPTENTNIIVNKNIEAGTDKATLTLEDGLTIALEKGSDYQTGNVNSNGEEIIYDAGERESTEVAYNYLTTPRGGQFHVVLSDGTEVWLNSESKIKYPVSFKAGETRQVELVYGEAYFDVSPSTNHKGATFRVLSKIQDIEVLGTEFNIKAYEDETHNRTTLVEGKVAVKVNDVKKTLQPNQQAIVNSETKIIEIHDIDVYNEISWKDGVFSFENMPMKDIMKVLSRWYDVEVAFENEAIENIKFIGVFRKNLSFNEILEIINNTNNIAYDIENNTVIFK